MKTKFNYYNEKPVIIKPTIKELLGTMKSEQKEQILNAFIKGIMPNQLKHETGMSERVIVCLYQAINSIEQKSKVLLRGELVIEWAEYDKEGEITKPAVYNAIPKTIIQLKDALKDKFKNEFTELQLMTVLNKMVAFSKYAGNGIWNFYSTEIKK